MPREDWSSRGPVDRTERFRLATDCRSTGDKSQGRLRLVLLDESGEQAGMDKRQITSEHQPSGIGGLTESRKKSGHRTFRPGFVPNHLSAFCPAWNTLSIAQREISLWAKMLQQRESIRGLAQSTVANHQGRLVAPHARTSPPGKQQTVQLTFHRSIVYRFRWQPVGYLFPPTHRPSLTPERHPVAVIAKGLDWATLHSREQAGIPVASVQFSMSAWRGRLRWFHSSLN